MNSTKHLHDTSGTRHRGITALGGLGGVLIAGHLAVAAFGAAALWDWLGGVLAGLFLVAFAAVHVLGGARLGHNLVGRMVSMLVRAGVSLGPVTLLTVAGRRSGLPRTNPVDVFGAGELRWIVATHSARAHWVRNLRAAGRASLGSGSRSTDFTAVELPTERAAQILKDLVAPRLSRPVGGLVLRRTLGLGRRATPADFARIVTAHPVFELTPVA
ncbi:nitroreductase family deazaflavin-dependent oxidoreductase [Nocardia tengchongensis]|uniref:Nitroreductase family deazaflavin-dependent oxidoreductase n=1 Tax=Nocardia tengchongensis TaxID=2055889 RepID=A0ABX8CFC5_9NOCA|nr:nitroreductase family deazaflavin-dependent oxidoreductase [Nocardia tengchongensis]QVI18678.1 nitroreductase family deazaflavin-dependent oxidoreductase [Nocardia tengchongensis]